MIGEFDIYGVYFPAFAVFFGALRFFVAILVESLFISENFAVPIPTLPNADRQVVADLTITGCRV